MALVYICCYAFISFFCLFMLLSIPFLYFLKSGIDKSTERSTIPACPSLMCFFNRGEGTNSSKQFVFNVCVCFVLCKFVSGLVLWFLKNLWFDDLCA